MTNEIEIEQHGPVTLLTIDREARRNALDHHAVDHLRAALGDAVCSGTKALVLTGAGTSGFCAGDDIKAYRDRSPEQSRQHFANGLKLMDELMSAPFLTIAAIEGYCMGGGLELALCCDHRIASEAAIFGMPELRKLKANPTWGGLTNLPRLIGLPLAKRLVLMGERWDAQQALGAGLIDQTVEVGATAQTATKVAQSFAEDVDAAVVADAKAIMHAAMGLNDRTFPLINLLAERAQPFEGD
jgi:enoyl-CoA hydratase